MTAGLETFAKVRALHDSTNSLGEKAAAMVKMQTLARKAGMSVEEAVSTLDAPAPKPRNLFEDLFNTPEFRASQAERERQRAIRRADALAEYGSEDAVWGPRPWEQALEVACRPVVVRKPIIGGEMDTLAGWDGGGFERMPPEVREAASLAYPLPDTVHEAWTEFLAWEKLSDDRIAFFPDYSPDVRERARTTVLEHLLDTLPAGGMRDLRARLAWMQHLLDLGFSRDVREDQHCLTTLTADIERMGARLKQESEAVQSGHEQGSAQSAHPSRSPHLGTGQSVQNGYVASTLEHSAETGENLSDSQVSSAPVSGARMVPPFRGNKETLIHSLSKMDGSKALRLPQHPCVGPTPRSAATCWPFSRPMPTNPALALYPTARSHAVPASHPRPWVTSGGSAK